MWGYDALAQCVAVSHAAVLIDDAQGLLLVEKTNPQAPYQATQFETRAEVKEYLLTTLAADDARYDMATPPRIVTENGAEMGA